MKFHHDWTHRFARSMALLALFASGAAWADAPGLAIHKALSSSIEGAINWAEHLQKEANLAAKMNPAHLQEEIQGLQGAFSEMNMLFEKLAAQSPGDVREGHFLQFQIHRKNAAQETAAFETAHKNNPTDSRRMKKIAASILKELRSAQREHLYEKTETQ